MFLIKKILEYRLFLKCFHFKVSSFITRMAPKCECCKNLLKKIASCKTCWLRKGDELDGLQKTDVEKYWTKIEPTWLESFDHFEVILSVLFL